MKSLVLALFVVAVAGVPASYAGSTSNTRSTDNNANSQRSLGLKETQTQRITPTTRNTQTRTR